MRELRGRDEVENLVNNSVHSAQTRRRETQTLCSYTRRDGFTVYTVQLYDYEHVSPSQPLGLRSTEDDVELCAVTVDEGGIALAQPDTAGNGGNARLSPRSRACVAAGTLAARDSIVLGGRSAYAWKPRSSKCARSARADDD
jgi:hypothetical protein